MYDRYGSKHVDVLLLHVLVGCWVLSELVYRHKEKEIGK